MKLCEVGEFGFIDRIAARVRHDRTVAVGIGDDAAALANTPGHVTLVTSDMLVEGVHFDLSFTGPFDLGKKSLAVNLSDLAAMGARPRHFLLSLALPSQLPLDFLDPFIAGLMGRADRSGMVLVGGDTCSSRGGLVISITAMGEQLPEQVVRRNGARNGDLIYVTGTVGDAALGLEELRTGRRATAAIGRHLDPEPRNEAGSALAERGLATAMIDISDGLLADLGHIAEQSGVGATVELSRLPLSEYFRQQAPAMVADPFSLALSGGEDYELLFTTAPSRAAEVEELLACLGQQATRIGAVDGSGKIRVAARDGSEYHPLSSGYDHFSG